MTFKVEGVRGKSFSGQIDHVVRLVVKHGGVAPCPLFGAPVGKFRRNARIDVRPDLLVADEMDEVSGVLDDLFEVLGHCSTLPMLVRDVERPIS